MASTYEESRAMASVFEKKLAESEANLEKLLATETEVANRIEDVTRTILAMKRVISTLRSGLPPEEPAVPVMPQATGLRDMMRNVDREELANQHFLTPEEAERAMEQAYARASEEENA